MLLNKQKQNQKNNKITTKNPNYNNNKDKMPTSFFDL